MPLSPPVAVPGSRPSQAPTLAAGPVARVPDLGLMAVSFRAALAAAHSSTTQAQAVVGAVAFMAAVAVQRSIGRLPALPHIR